MMGNTGKAGIGSLDPFFPFRLTCGNREITNEVNSPPKPLNNGPTEEGCR